MDSNRAFLDEVLAHPEDDAPRLIYADWLQEYGDPRGDFIRVQCELNQLDDLDPRYIELEMRSRQLLLEHGDQWANELDQDLRKAEFNRGFIETITIRARAFLKSAAELYRSTPVKWLRFNYLKGAGSAIAEFQALSQVEFLDLINLKIPDEDLTALLTSPHLQNLKGLKIGGYDFSGSPSFVDAICQSRFATSLRHLELSSAEELPLTSSTTIGFTELEHLTLSTHGRMPAMLMSSTMPKLQSLHFASDITANEARKFSELLTENLKELHLSGMPAAGIRALAERNIFTSIEHLNLAGSNPGIRSIETIFTGNQLKQCHTLNLYGTAALAESASADAYIDLLAGHDALSSLRRLRVSNLQPGQLGRIASSSALQKLHELHVDDSELSIDDIQSIQQNSISRSLRRISLGNTYIPTKAMEVFSEVDFSNLIDLAIDYRYGYLHEGKLKIERPLCQLIESKSLRQLRRLTIAYLGLTEKTLESIANRSNFHELRHLVFDGNRGTNPMMRRVLESDRLAKLDLFSLEATKGLRRADKWKAEFGTRLNY